MNTPRTATRVSFSFPRLRLPGAVGVWSVRSPDVRGPDGPLPDGEAAWRITLTYLESDPVDFAARLCAAQDDGPAPGAPAAVGAAATELLAGPLCTITPWQWDRFDTPGSR